MTSERAEDPVRGADSASSIDAAELAKFEAMAARWWDPAGPMAPLHAMNPVRLDWMLPWLRSLAGEARPDADPGRPLGGLRVLDVGCGGGLVAEPLARLGAAVTGIDPSAEVIAAARAHAAQAGLAVDYQARTAEALAASGAVFDAVLALEVVEHVEDRPAFLCTLAALVRPGGLVLLSTLNRTARSFALAVVGAEWVLGWLPRGTHDWRRFPRPEELSGWLAAAGLRPLGTTGFVFHPLRGAWHLSEEDLSVNYAIAARRDG
ncbi:bifunctional 2-polyprenyl-6-hydroxyphenol methylase/3-demethylubiquinol 3-O-methyltransferase UbiG [Rubellimicrobium sp. CFH 75288]|uniref:bifunctional 2-polyprenyl-6-hydroxyphenol methylase/3-demethylubiquinol 3-O-methyltransferase UbiG n=1 Tax=Rubellimicrobium sp. CFH 75288 TaxID=2697034 RepID=UPI0014127D1D|nr:bifunctional 2-polyprenyl-6-hydroxyphenol methylase/3-demethylubiquinol 3-O-methyltransferase UbiG [Rubellimicrobium sp. CFH 75288]NAZ37742.1 bifunctional 2-polyprenyl-6-hydroxyphenol methylase/3-demethylubiquinol 3-O-methyltransferase UbiG [Rubellimicrobium sp. CFH 75288]